MFNTKAVVYELFISAFGFRLSVPCLIYERRQVLWAIPNLLVLLALNRLWSRSPKWEIPSKGGLLVNRVIPYPIFIMALLYQVIIMPMLWQCFENDFNFGFMCLGLAVTVILCGTQYNLIYSGSADSDMPFQRTVNARIAGNSLWGLLFLHRFVRWSRCQWNRFRKGNG